MKSIIQSNISHTSAIDRLAEHEEHLKPTLKSLQSPDKYRPLTLRWTQNDPAPKKAMPFQITGFSMLNHANGEQWPSLDKNTIVLFDLDHQTPRDKEIVLVSICGQLVVRQFSEDANGNRKLIAINSEFPDAIGEFTVIGTLVTTITDEY